MTGPTRREAALEDSVLRKSVGGEAVRNLISMSRKRRIAVASFSVMMLGATSVLVDQHEAQPNCF